MLAPTLPSLSAALEREQSHSARMFVDSYHGHLPNGNCREYFDENTVEFFVQQLVEKDVKCTKGYDDKTDFLSVEYLLFSDKRSEVLG